MARRSRAGGVTIESNLTVPKALVINIPDRKDRRSRWKQHAASRGLAWDVVAARRDEDAPEVARFHAHLHALATAKRHRWRAAVIFEDDAQILSTRFLVPMPPGKSDDASREGGQWDMLWLGGRIQRVIDDAAANTNAVWKRACVMLSHSYIVHARMFDRLISEGHALLKNASASGAVPPTLSEWYCNVIHPQVNCFALAPDLVIQTTSHSDVHHRVITYNQQLTRDFARPITKDASESGGENAREIPTVPLVEAPESTPEERVVRLDVPHIAEDDLPQIALLTPTSGNKELFYLTTFSFFRFVYPPEKLEWIVCDDNVEEQKVRDLLPNDPRIKYVCCKMGAGSATLSVGKKLNMCMGYVSPETKYVLHFFDNVMYPPPSVLARVKTLSKDGGHAVDGELVVGSELIVGCTDFGVYDAVLRRSYETCLRDFDNRKNILQPATLGYAPSVWKSRPFEESMHDPALESHAFTRARAALALPFRYIGYVLDVNDGLKALRKIGSGGAGADGGNFADEWDAKTREFMDVMRETLL